MDKIIINNTKEFITEEVSGKISLNNILFEGDVFEYEPNKFNIIYKQKVYNVELVNADAETKKMILKVNNKIVESKIKSSLDELLEKLGISDANSGKLKELKAPMPGLVLKINVSEGDTVQKGDAILVLEAMKMENNLKAAGTGKIKKIHVSKGVAVEKNELLISFE